MAGTELQIAHRAFGHRDSPPVFCRISSHTLDSVWPQVSEIWERDSCRGSNKPSQLYRAVCLELADLWIIRLRNEIVGVIITVPEASHLSVYLAAGYFIEAWAIPFCQYFGRYAKDRGYGLIEIYCRNGWKEYANEFARVNPSFSVKVKRDPGRLDPLALM